MIQFHVDTPTTKLVFIGTRAIWEREREREGEMEVAGMIKIVIFVTYLIGFCVHWCWWCQSKHIVRLWCFTLQFFFFIFSIVFLFQSLLFFSPLLLLHVFQFVFFLPFFLFSILFFLCFVSLECYEFVSWFRFGAIFQSVRWDIQSERIKRVELLVKLKKERKAKFYFQLKQMLPRDRRLRFQSHQ